MQRRSHTSHAEWTLHVGGNRTVLMGSFHPGTIQHFEGAKYHLDKTNLFPEKINEYENEASLVYTSPEKIDHFLFKKAKAYDIGLEVANKTGLLEAAEGAALLARAPHHFFPIQESNLDFRGHRDEQMLVITHSPEQAASAIRQLVGIGAVDLRQAARSFVWSMYQSQEDRAAFECALPISQQHEARVQRSIQTPPDIADFISALPMALRHQPDKNLADSIRDTALDLSGLSRSDSRGPTKDGYRYLTLTEKTLNRLSPVAQQLMADPKERLHDFTEHPGRY